MTWDWGGDLGADLDGFWASFEQVWGSKWEKRIRGGLGADFGVNSGCFGAVPMRRSSSSDLISAILSSAFRRMLGGVGGKINRVRGLNPAIFGAKKGGIGAVPSLTCTRPRRPPWRWCRGPAASCGNRGRLGGGKGGVRTPPLAPKPLRFTPKPSRPQPAAKSPQKSTLSCPKMAQIQPLAPNCPQTPKPCP